MIIVGNGSLGEQLQDKVKSYELEDNIIFIESIPNKNISELYLLSDVFINLSDTEIYGMSILESMYCKCPVVARSAPGPCFIIDDNMNGLIVENYNIDEWVTKIQYAIVERDSLGRSAHEKINNYLTWQVIANEYRLLFIEMGLLKVGSNNVY